MHFRLRGQRLGNYTQTNESTPNMTLFQLQCLLEVCIFDSFSPLTCQSFCRLMTHAHITSSCATAMFAPIIGLNYFCMPQNSEHDLGFSLTSKVGLFHQEPTCSASTLLKSTTCAVKQQCAMKTVAKCHSAISFAAFSYFENNLFQMNIKKTWHCFIQVDIRVIMAIQLNICCENL